MLNAPATNPEGFLLDLTHWQPAVAQVLASNENLTLTTEHFAIISVIREFYQQYQLHPSMRALIKLLQQKITQPNSAIDSIYVHIKFPGGIKQLSKIAGLPKPINCI